MGFWDIFKKKKEPGLVSMQFQEIQEWIEKKKEENEEESKNFVSNVKTTTSEFTEKLTELISVLEKVDVDEKKAEEKVKFITKESRQHYIIYLGKLLENLEKIAGSEENLIEKINNQISYFEKRSSSSFQKTTLLIGKEMENIKKTITEYLSSLKKIAEENKKFLDSERVFYEIEKTHKNLLEFQESIRRIEEQVKEIEKDNIGLKEGIMGREKQIENIKKSERFLEQEKKKQFIELKKQELDKQLMDLKGKIDFKALANFYHSFEKDMETVKSYRDNFKSAFQRSNGEEIIKLLKESKIGDEEVLDLINNIKKNNLEIKNINPEPTGIDNLEKEINNFNLIIEKNNARIIKEQKRADKTKDNMAGTKQQIIDKFKEINIDIF